MAQLRVLPCASCSPGCCALGSFCRRTQLHPQAVGFGSCSRERGQGCKQSLWLVCAAAGELLPSEGSCLNHAKLH